MQLTWNTRLGLWWTAGEMASQSIRAGDVLSGYIYIISHSNSAVGYVGSPLSL